MTDVLTPEQRRLNMSRIGGRDTKPEMLVRRGLHARGLRYKLHDKNLPGRPDLVLPRFRSAIFVHGCFWHCHGCELCKIPATRQDFWLQKLNANAIRDAAATMDLRQRGWRVLIVWECALRGRRRMEYNTLLDSITEFLTKGDCQVGQIGVQPGAPGAAPAALQCTAPADATRARS